MKIAVAVAMLLVACETTSFHRWDAAPCRPAMPDLVFYDSPVRLEGGIDIPFSRSEPVPDSATPPLSAGRLLRESLVPNTPSHPVELPAHPVDLPAHAVTMPEHALVIPGHAVLRPAHPVGMPGHPLGLPAAAVEAPAPPIDLPGSAVTRPYSAFERPSHPVQRPSSPITRAAPAR